MTQLPAITIDGRDKALATLKREVDRGYFLHRLRWLLGYRPRTPEFTKKKYDLMAGDYQAQEQALTQKQRELAIVGNEVGLANRIEMLNFIRSYISQRLGELGCRSIIEVGAGELNTLIPVANQLALDAVAVDISELRLLAGMKAPGSEIVSCLTADASNLPFKNDSFDVVFTSHCLEQSPGILREALREFARIAVRHIVLVEPAYELAHPLQRKRIRKMNYVRGIVKTAEHLGLEVIEHTLMPARFYLNGSALTIIKV